MYIPIYPKKIDLTLMKKKDDANWLKTTKLFQCVTRLKKGENFGSLAFIAESTRAASILSLTDCTLAILDRDVFIEKLKKNQKRILSKKINYLKKQLFKDFRNKELMRMSFFWKEKNYSLNAVIFKEK